MSWNQSNTAAAGKAQKAQKKNRGLLAGLLVVIIASSFAYVYYVFGQRNQVAKPICEEGKSKVIVDVAAHVAKIEIDDIESARVRVQVKTKTSEEDAKEKARAEKIAVIKRRQAKLAEAREKMQVRKQPYEIFAHSCENLIAGLLMTEPGTPVLVPPNYTDHFEEDFQESCKEPIVIKDNDSDYVKQVKQAMIECKIELCNRMSNGEKLSDILSETHRELRKLGGIRDDIMRITRQEIRENAKCAEDVDMLFDAANKMLASKGIAPMKDTPVLRRNFHRIAERNAMK